VNILIIPLFSKIIKVCAKEKLISLFFLRGFLQKIGKEENLGFFKDSWINPNL